MTSNLASEVIAEHALFLRKEQHENKLIDDNSKKMYLFFSIVNV